MKHIIPADRCWTDTICPYRCPFFVQAQYDVAKREWATRPWCRRQDKEVVNGARVEGCRIVGDIVIEFQER